MNLSELKMALAKTPEAGLLFQLPSGDTISAHAHVTEVARIDKRFVDCGGTLRNDARCQLQTWVANDVEHRLTAGKLLSILSKARSLLQSDELPVDVEHEVGWTSQFPLDSAALEGGVLVLHLAARH